jgi:lipid A disaccharide synthetase
MSVLGIKYFPLAKKTVSTSIARPQTGGLARALAAASLAIASTGTVTLECAYFRILTVTLYRTSLLPSSTR